MKTHIQALTKLAALLLFSTFLFLSCSKKNESINRELEKPSLISPKANAEGVPIEDVELTWQKIMAPNGGEITFDVYFDDKENPSQMVASGLTANSFTLKDKLAIHTPYFWKVIAKDETGAKSESNIGTFTTRKANTAELILGKWVPDSDDECVRKNSYIHFSESVFTMTYIISSGADCRAEPVSFPYEFVSENSIHIHFPNGDTEVFTVFSISEDEIEFALSGMGSGRAIRAKED